MFITKTILPRRTRDLLMQSGLSMPTNIDETVGVYEGNKLIGTGSLSGNILKGIAVDQEYRGAGITAHIIDGLLAKANERNINHLIIFTKDEYGPTFARYGFNQIALVPGMAVMLEWGKPDILDFKAGLAEIAAKYPVNKNALVLGSERISAEHIHLIEIAAATGEHLFVLLPDCPNDLAPFDERSAQLKNSTNHLTNVNIISGDSYILSPDTFPSYFMSPEDHFKYYAALDLQLFGQYIAPALGISKRWIETGSANRNVLIYNKLMRENLEPIGIRIEEISLD